MMVALPAPAPHTSHIPHIFVSNHHPSSYFSLSFIQLQPDNICFIIRSSIKLHCINIHSTKHLKSECLRETATHLWGRLALNTGRVSWRFTLARALITSVLSTSPGASPTHVSHGINTSISTGVTTFIYLHVLNWRILIGA